MPAVFPFAAIRPSSEALDEVHCAPYDTMNQAEAQAMVAGKPNSFLHVDRPDIHFGSDTDPHADEVYQRARIELDRLIANGALRHDLGPVFSIYRQTMKGRQQTGLVSTVLAADYASGVIKRHEFTRPEKEDDRVAHIESTGCQCSPVFLAYRSRGDLDALIAAPAMTPPSVDFVDDLDVRHELWIIEDQEKSAEISAAFGAVSRFYVADGHHRSAAAVRIADAHTNSDSAQRFLAVTFPHDQLYVMDYNRFIHDLNGLSQAEFLAALDADFDVTAGEGSPNKARQIGMFIDGGWKYLTAKAHTYEGRPAVEALDVAILQRHVLAPLLGIDDPRRSSRIDFIGGIRGMEELETKVNGRSGSLAFAMFPTSMDELLNVADADDIMPPKSTWFEPKLRSGLFLNPVLR
jgi:uncharacterized protein (DUF1015 family)